MGVKTHLKLFLLVFNAVCGQYGEIKSKPVCEKCTCGEIKRYLDIEDNNEIVLNIQCSELDRIESFPDLNKVVWPRNPNKLKITASFEGLALTTVGRLPVNDYVETLSLSNNAVKSLWPNAFSDLPNLRKLSLSHNEIEEVTPDMFTNLRKLEELDLSSNQLVDFNKLDFASLKSLRRINLSNNLLKTIPLDVLGEIPTLEELDMSKNRVFNFRLVSGGQNKLKMLKRLNLNENKIPNILADIFPENCTLESLDLSNNVITTVEKHAFGQCHSLRELRLANNEITRLFELPAKLQIVDLSYNNFQQWPLFPSEIQYVDMSFNTLVDLFDEVYVDFDNLEVLKLAGNKLRSFEIQNKLLKLFDLDLSYNIMEKIPQSINNDTLPALEELRLDGNPIEDIHFERRINLTILYLNDMPLVRSIESGAFTNVKGRNTNGSEQECFHLYMSSCDALTVIDEGAFRNTSLCYLDISYNNLSSIERGLLDWGRVRDGVNLQGNSWICDCNLQWLLDELLPQVYATQPNLLHELRCESPRALQGLRLVHWFNWGERALCSNSSQHGHDHDSLMVEPSTDQGLNILKGGSLTFILVGCIVAAALIAISLTAYLIFGRHRSYRIRQAMLRKRQTLQDQSSKGLNREQFTALNRT